MAMTALERITFPCLKYLDKERKVGKCIKKDLIYCLIVSVRDKLLRRNIILREAKISSKVEFEGDPWCMPYAPQQKARWPNLFPDLRRQNSRC